MIVTANKPIRTRRIKSKEAFAYYKNMQLAYKMASLGANTIVLNNFSVVDKRLEASINKNLSKYRKGAGWITTHVIHRAHANIVYRNYCHIAPDNADLHRPVSAEELISLARVYFFVYKNEFLDINRIYYIFVYLRNGTYNRKVCKTCGIDYIFHASRNYYKCPFCAMSSTLFIKKDFRKLTRIEKFLKLKAKPFDFSKPF